MSSTISGFPAKKKCVEENACRIPQNCWDLPSFFIRVPGVPNQWKALGKALQTGHRGEITFINCAIRSKTRFYHFMIYLRLWTQGQKTFPKWSPFLWAGGIETIPNARLTALDCPHSILRCFYTHEYTWLPKVHVCVCESHINEKMKRRVTHESSDRDITRAKIWGFTQANLAIMVCVQSIFEENLSKWAVAKAGMVDAEVTWDWNPNVCKWRLSLYNPFLYLSTWFLPNDPEASPPNCHHNSSCRPRKFLGDKISCVVFGCLHATFWNQLLKLYLGHPRFGCLPLASV